MKKIFFIFAMMLMSVVSVWAEESSESFNMNEMKLSYSGDHFEISGVKKKGEYGLKIDGNNKISISAKNDEIITKVVYWLSLGDEDVDAVKASNGIVDYENHTINGINATYLEISTEGGSGKPVVVQSIDIYYKESNDPIVDEYDQIENFAVSEGQYTGTNINVTGVGNGSNGLSIGNGNTVTIGSNDNISLEISRVDLEFGGNVDGTTLNSTAGGAVDGDGTSWSIKNINSPSTTISLSSGSGYIKNIKVYYIEVSEESGEKSVTFDTESGLRYLKNNIGVTGTYRKYGLEIANRNSVTIASDNGE